MSRNVESAILSACFISEESISKVVEQLTANDFTYKTHKEIFYCILNLFNRNEKIDLITVIAEKDKQKYNIENHDINEIADIVMTDTHIDSHIKLLQENTLKRNMKKFVLNLNNQLNEGNDINETIDTARETLMQIDTSNRKNDYTAMEAVLETVGQIEASMKSGKPVGLSTYIHDLDYYIIMKPGNLITIASKKGVGKTMLANQIGFENAFKDKKVVFFTMEMEVQELINREISRRAKINLSDINHGKVEEIDRYNFEADVISSFSFIIDDNGKQTVPKIHSKLIKYQNKLKGLDLVIIDYIQLMKGGTGDSRQQRLADTSGNLKALAKYFKVPVIILSQLNHEGITREAEDIENDSDIVLKLRRPYYEEQKEIKREIDGEYKAVVPEENFAQLRVTKNRSGRTGKIDLTFMGQYQSFFGWEQER